MEHQGATCPSLALPETGLLGSGSPDADFYNDLRNVVSLRGVGISEVNSREADKYVMV